MKPKVAIFLADGYEMGEAIIVIDILRRAQITVDIVSVTKSLRVESSHHVIILCEKFISDLKFEEYNMLILPGGSRGVDILAQNELLQTHIIHYAQDKNKKIAAICAAPQILGKLKLLENKKITFYPGAESGLENTIKTTDPVVVSDNIILGKSLGCAFQFALAIVAALLNPKVAATIKQELQF